jgi:eukaryotic-like serine/threonine-protein kinase
VRRASAASLEAAAGPGVACGVATELLEPFEARVGSTLKGKWRLERLLGVGGMAAVYAARHRVGSMVAIKILHPEIARSNELRLRFEREAMVMGRLEHPGAVSVLDVDVTDEGAPFLVMELLEGESLKERVVRGGHLPMPDLLRVADEALDVLAAAHGEGIVHRDVKPDNLFLTAAGPVKVLDFGIAQMREGAVMTMVGERLGTLPYMPPEQVRGSDIDGRVDLFALGAVMFRIIAGRRVHDVKTESDMLVAMSSEPAPPLVSVCATAPDGVCRVVDRALMFDRERRYPDARSMQRDVQALRRGEEPTLAMSAAPAQSAPSSATAAPMSSPPTRVGQAMSASGAAMSATGAAMSATAAATPYGGPAGSFGEPGGGVVVVGDGAPMSATAMPEAPPSSEMPKTGLLVASHPSAHSDRTKVSTPNPGEATKVSSGIVPALAAAGAMGPSGTMLATEPGAPASSGSPFVGEAYAAPALAVQRKPDRTPLFLLAAAGGVFVLMMLGGLLWALSSSDANEDAEATAAGEGGGSIGDVFPPDQDNGDEEVGASTTTPVDKKGPPPAAQPRPPPTPIKLPTLTPPGKTKKKKKKKKKKK